MARNDFVTAFAPASIGNVAVGFDMLGLAVAKAGDRVAARRASGSGIRILEVHAPDGQPHRSLSNRADENTASIAASALWEQHGEGGVEIVVRKGVPLKSGMGSSAASAVAAVVAVNALLDTPLHQEKLLPYALAGEKFASNGLHADNVAPSLLGGMVFCPSQLLPDVVRIGTPGNVSSVLLHPALEVSTAESRSALRREVTMQDWLAQQAYLAGFVSACEQQDIDLMRRCLKDVIIEPQRAASVPCFRAVQEAALGAGAIGCSLSGSGPAIFALCETGIAAELAMKMEHACRAEDIACRTWISPLDAPGAHIVDD